MMKKFCLFSIFIIACSLQPTFGQNSKPLLAEIVVEGNVLGYELNTVLPTSMDGYFPEYPVLIKIRKVIEGEEKAQFIIVLLKYLSKEDAEKNFGLDKITTFRLVQRAPFRKNIKQLLHSGFTLENGELVKTAQTFKFLPGVEKKLLPLKMKVPFYAEMREITEI
jgi:hypothetical protein